MTEARPGFAADPAQRITASLLLDRARDIAGLLREEAGRGDEAGALTDRTMAALRGGGFFSLMLPQCLGGAEANPVAALRVIEELSAADGSTGWVVMAAGLCIGTAAAFLSDAAVAEIFAADSVPIIAGHGGANGTAVVERDGFRLSGNWRYGSGTKHAAYIHSGAVILENGTPRRTPAGEPEIRIFVTPRQDAALADNWDVLGLRATGSVDYTITDLFVPEGFSHPPGMLVPKRGGNVYRIGLLGIAVIGHTGFALGVGRRALDEIAAFARAQSSGPTGRLRDSDAFREQYGRSEAHFRAARALVYETWQDIETGIQRGDPMSTRQITLARLAMSHVTSIAADLCSFAYRNGGGVALRDGPLQRCFRDIHAGTQHLHAHPLILRECGRELAGLATGQVWGRFGLIDVV
jgi:alkylation response protein AidB-like acyl-CoA dehydrogenase